MTGEDQTDEIPPPWLPELNMKKLVEIFALAFSQAMAPPVLDALFSSKELALIDGSQLRLYIAAPSEAVFSLKLFSLIDDPNKEIRNCILGAIAKHKSSALGNTLLNYLKENAAKKDPEHVLACYEALGRCGSNSAVPYLRRILLDKGWNSFMGSGKLVFREGAAIALAYLDTPEAKEVLQKASSSRFRCTSRSR